MGELINRAGDDEKRRNLRRRHPPAEVMLWQQLRNRRLGGFKFKRQYGIAHYVADFCCTNCLIVVEIDGPSHADEAAVAYDRIRQEFFESHYLLVIRFTNEQVYKQMPVVLENLLFHCEQRKNMNP